MRYIFFTTNTEYTKAHEEQNKILNIQHIYGDKIFFKNKIIWKLFRFHISPRINSIINLPFKKIWHKVNKKIINQLHINKNEKICLVFSVDYYMYRFIGFFKQMKNEYNCHLILSFKDRVDLYKKNKVFDLDYLKQEFDLIYTYNKIDAIKYSIKLAPPVIEKNDENENEYDIINDVFFVGLDKGRAKIIGEIYTLCNNIGLKCDFNLVGKVSSKKIEGINYCSRIPYIEVLNKLKKAKCILNIIQNECEGITLRDHEAYAYGKYILTNNQSKLLQEIFNEEQLIYISDENIKEKLLNLKESFTKFACKANPYTHENFLEWIENNL